MMLRTVPVWVLIVIFVLGLSACRDEGAEGPSLTDTETLSDSIDAGYERIQRAYESADTVSPDLRRMRGAMGQMHQRMHGGGGMGGGMHGQGGMRGRRHHGGQQGARADSAAMREWHQQMMGMHAEMARMHGEQGNQQLSRRHRRQEQRHRRMMGALPAGEGMADVRSARESDVEEEEALVDGAKLYAQECAVCHGQNGQGIGSFPPLAESEWVQEDEETPIRILLHGLQGEIEVDGRTYNNIMPAFGRRLSDKQIAGILSHIRTSWGNGSDAVDEEDVESVRRTYSNRSRPWTASTLSEN